MNAAIALLRERISDQNFRFIFPSQVSASLWARKTCSLGLARSVAEKRFLAWDRFKEEAVRERETAKEPVTALMRKLFAEALIRKNAEAVRGAGTPHSVGAANPGKPGGFPLKAVIPPEYAEGGRIFAPFIAGLLPSLSSWEKMMKNARRGSKSFAADAEDEDFGMVKNEYAKFLERYNLFEPSWEEIKLREEGARYAIFFPELIEDFAEYDALLQPPQFIRVGADAAAKAEGPALLHYQSAREEIRAAATEIERLHGEEGVPYEDMAVSVPELEEMEPCLLKEFSLRCIPVARRAGKKLGETGAGRIFSLINECAASRFSFNSLKALLLCDHIPWKEREKNKALINFGIKYNCVSSYAQDGKAVDIWEEAFDEGKADGGRELRPYYGELKRRILELSGSKNFRELRNRYFAFRGYPSKSGETRRGLLDMERISKEDDAVLSRCVEELGALIELEEKFSGKAAAAGKSAEPGPQALEPPDLVPAAPLAFFLSCLGETEYVRAGQKPGVNIYKWRVAAAAPFSCHFALNASQGAATVLYRPMKFLRQDKRAALGLEDRDATRAFFLLCDTGDDGNYKPRTRISASTQTFSGWAVPHSYFAEGKTAEPPPCPEDPYGAERRFWKTLQKKGGTAKGGGLRGPSSGKAAELQKIYPLQKKSYDAWKSARIQNGNGFSFFVSPVPDSSPARELLKRASLDNEGLLAVSPTRDLNVYFNCPLFWLYDRIFDVKEFSLEAALLDDASLGILYHKILEKLFARIKNEGGSFNSRRLDLYKRWAREITRAAIREDPAFKGPLAIPLVSPQAAGMAKKIARVLELESDNFDGYQIADLEFPVSLKTEEFRIKGIIDRVSISPNGDPVIVDYKTSGLPDQTARDDLEEVPLMEFQMPLYIKLYEENLREKYGPGSGKVREAFFYSVAGKKIKAAMGEKAGGRAKAPNREEYEPYLEAAERQIAEFGRKVKALDFVPKKMRAGECASCVYKTICRSAYFLNAPAPSAGEEEN